MIPAHITTTTDSQREAAGSSHLEVGITREAQASPSRPEFFRLPSHGGDPYFGLTRSFYYEGEKRGYWRLVRLRERGKLRGVTLVPFDAVSSFVRSEAGGAACEEEASTRAPTFSKLGLSPNVGFRQFLASQGEGGK
jgi:hypothetical protein